MNDFFLQEGWMAKWIQMNPDEPLHCDWKCDNFNAKCDEAPKCDTLILSRLVARWIFHSLLMHWLSHYNVIENEILAFFITIMCDDKFHHTLRASVIALKCDKNYHHILSVLIITTKCDVGLITLIMRWSLHFQREWSYAARWRHSISIHKEPQNQNNT